MAVMGRWGRSCLAVLLLLACSGKETKHSHSAGAGAGAGAASGSGGGSTRGGTSAQGGGSSEPDTALEALPRSYAEALCTAFENCWTAFIDATDGREGCVRLIERLGRDSLFARLGDAVSEGRIEYHPEALSGCLREIETGSCEDQADHICPGLFVGMKRAGDPCELDEECAADAQCLVRDTCPGRCGPRPALGEACTEANACAAGLSCAAQADATSVCVVPARLTEKCGTFQPCAGLLYCHERGSGAPEPSGTCIERKLPHDGDVGSACDGLGAEQLCKPGLVCSFVQENGETVGRCHERAESGGACTYSLPDACPPAEYCHIDTALGVKPATGTCLPRPKLGEGCRYGTIHVAPCGDGIEQVCHLESEVCVAVKRLGEACTSDEECFGADCASGRCTARLECERASAETM